MFDTTAGKLNTMVNLFRTSVADEYCASALIRQAIGSRLHATGNPYSACTTDAERDGWIAAFSASIDAGRAATYMAFAEALRTRADAAIEARADAPELEVA